MAIKSSLLKEAIADAKALKKVAIEAARESLKESFTPRIQSQLSQKIQNEIEGGEEETEEVPEPEYSDEGGSGEEEVPISDEPEMDEPIDVVPDETDVPAEEPVEEPAPEPEDENLDIELEALIRELDDEADEIPEEEPMDDEEIYETEDEVDIDSIIDEIMDSTTIGNSDNKKPSPSASDSSKIGSKKDKTVGDNAKESKDFLAEEEDYEMDDDSINIDEIINELEEGSDDVFDEPIGNPDEDMLGDVDIDEIISELEEPSEDMTDSEDILANDNLNENKRLRGRVKKLQKSLREHVEAVSYMKNKLSEVNLLNAKLLYTSKLLRSNTLTQEQKNFVIETFDRAVNPREAKFAYVTLAESFRKSGNRKVKITESITKPTPSTKSSKPQVLNEVSDIAKRYKELSGLDKSKMPNYRT